MVWSIRPHKLYFKPWFGSLLGWVMLQMPQSTSHGHCPGDRGKWRYILIATQHMVHCGKVWNAGLIHAFSSVFWRSCPISNWEIDVQSCGQMWLLRVTILKFVASLICRSHPHLHCRDSCKWPSSFLWLLPQHVWAGAFHCHCKTCRIT